MAERAAESAVGLLKLTNLAGRTTGTRAEGEVPRRSAWSARGRIMLFPTFPFLIFFVVVFAVYWGLANPRHRLVWLLLASVYFYASWNPWLVTLIVFSASVDYTVALVLERVQTSWKRRALLTL